MKLWFKLMELGNMYGCHQLPQRSFFYKKYQFPICARCTGVLISTIVAIFYFFRKNIKLKTTIIFSLIMFIDWLLQFLKIRESTNGRRLITGLIGGFGFTLFNLKILKIILNKSKKN